MTRAIAPPRVVNITDLRRGRRGRGRRGHDEQLGVVDGVGTEGQVPRWLGHVQPDAGLEPLAVVVNQRDERDGGFADVRRPPDPPRLRHRRGAQKPHEVGPTGLTRGLFPPLTMMGRMDRVYLDMCSLKRPFDDQRDSRVREEAAAVAAIIARAEAGEIALVRSAAHLVENDANPREDRRLAAALWIDGAAFDVVLDATVEARARELVTLAFSPLDALHLAFAERAGARWFVTCDDKLLKLAGRHGHALQILVVPPPALAWRNTP